MPMDNFDHKILKCPVTGEELDFVGPEEAKGLIEKYADNQKDLEGIREGFTNLSRTYFYPVLDDILLLLPVYALYIGSEEDTRDNMAFDKERVFKYYNEISYDLKNGYRLFRDSPKWVDYREVSKKYIRNSFTRAKNHINPAGKYLLDIASGPIGLEEYLALSENYEYRICADISVNALIQAKLNYSPRKGIFICADITNIPIRDNSCDAVLCQHTLYHIPRKEQETAVNELYRVAKPGTSIAIVYSLFYHSWFMNISLFPIQLYRILRHFAGKIYVRIFKGKPRLYFYPHSLGWFKRKFAFSRDMKFFCWRSTNKYFLNLYVHKWLRGDKILEWLRRSEEKHPQFWGKFGEYPIIVIRK